MFILENVLCSKRIFFFLMSKGEYDKSGENGWINRNGNVGRHGLIFLNRHLRPFCFYDGQHYHGKLGPQLERFITHFPVWNLYDQQTKRKKKKKIANFQALNNTICLVKLRRVSRTYVLLRTKEGSICLTWENTIWSLVIFYALGEKQFVSLNATQEAYLCLHQLQPDRQIMIHLEGKKSTYY